MALEIIWGNFPAIPEASETLARVCDICFSLEGISDAHMTVKIVDDEEIHQLNLCMRNIDRATDVLSFPAVRFKKGTTARDNKERLRREFDPSIGLVHLGDCAISLPRARAQAAEYGHTLLRELGFLTAHSAFHLMGYDHIAENDRLAMRAMEKRAMRISGLFLEDEEMDQKLLYDRACAALENAYAPYSHFRVGACVLSEAGKMYSGCNIENASYGATICAERAAVSKAISDGAKSFKAIAIVGEKARAWPCGICRQVLNEFSDDMLIICGQLGKEYTVVSLKELLPHAFGPNELNGGTPLAE